MFLHWQMVIITKSAKAALAARHNLALAPQGACHQKAEY
jgi:hypothetical protein